MEELAASLKKVREDKKITLEEISCRTKIQLRYLEALERCDFNSFAGEVYLKGVLGNYAAAIGLEPKEVLEQYNQLKAGLGAKPADTTQPAAEKLLPDQFRGSKSIRKKRRHRQENRGPSLSAGLIALMLILIGFGIWYSLNTEQPSTPQDPDEPSIVQPGENQEPDGEEPEQEPEPQPEVAVVSTAPGETVYSVSGPEEMELMLDFTAPCWIELVVDGAEPFTPRTFLEGEDYTVTAEQAIFLRMGHPPAVRIIVNGLELIENRTLTRPHNFRINLE